MKKMINFPGEDQAKKKRYKLKSSLSNVLKKMSLALQEGSTISKLPKPYLGLENFQVLALTYN